MYSKILHLQIFVLEKKGDFLQGVDFEHVFMRKIVVDFGNTRWKAAIFEGDMVGKPVSGTDYADLRSWILQNSDEHTKLGYASVVASQPMQQFSNAQEVTAFSDIPGLLSKYTTQHTLGVDRWCNVAAGKSVLPQEPNFGIIDLGTCIKFELVIQNEYLGGAIAPGVAMRFRSMAQGADQLPEVPVSDTIQVVGDSSMAAMQVGVQLGVLNEIEGWIQSVKSKYGELPIIITGGDAPKFVKDLKSSFFAVPELTLIGINALLD